MNGPVQTTGTLQTAMEHAARLLQNDPAMAAEQASEILKVAPGHPPATLLLGMAWRIAGDARRSLAVLEPLARGQPNWAKAHYELGLARADDTQPEAALRALQRAVALDPMLPDAWRAIGDQFTLAGDVSRADAAYAQHVRASTRDPRLLSAAAALVDGKIAEAEALLRAHLKQCPTDVAALRMLAEVAARLARNNDAELLLERCLELSPGFHVARQQYALILNRRNKPAAALRQIEHLEALDPRNIMVRNLKAVILARLGGYAEAIEIYGELLKAYPDNPKIWLSYGHTLATAGRDRDAIAAYRESIARAPQLGEAFWSLANLKTFRFSDAEKTAMHAQLARRDLSDEDRYHFDFALGKAHEDDARYADSFRHYLCANELRRTRLNYDAGDTSAFVRRSKELLTAEFFASRSGHGAAAADPIFIVGIPRAGSTLIEQILASHPSVEGTMELPDLIMIVETLSGGPKPGAGKPQPAEESPYLTVLGTLSAGACRQLGEDYLVRTRIQRKTSRPLFIDKMPNNFLHVGLIRLALPNAKIIDARRHPMACCFSAFKQQFAEGHRYSYSLTDVGRYYRDYVELMQHFDRAIPGTVHRVFYENMIADTETEIARLLAYCGLPFDRACLRFHENERPVRTASAQQVRRPIYRDGIEHWRHYEPWLQPLKESLGDVLDSYPETPHF